METNGLRESEKFRQTVATVFPSTVIRSELWIPRNSKSGRKSWEIDMKTMKMRTLIDENGEIKSELSIDWSDDLEEKKENQKKKMTRVNEKNGYIEYNGIPDFMKKIQCDGPCRQYVNSADVAQFGCDHSICRKCRQSTYSTSLFDGSPGCCHVDCLKKAAIDGMKFQSGRRLDSIHSTISLLSNSGPWEVLNVNICIIKKWGNHVYRTLLEYEFPSQTRVAELWNVLDEYRHCLSSSFGRSYYSWKKPQSYEDVQLISLIDTNLRFYNLMGYKPLFGGKLFILCVVSDGILVE